MANRSGNAYALTTLCPIVNGHGMDNDEQQSHYQHFANITRQRIQRLNLREKSLFATVPNTYLARLFILNDVFYEAGKGSKTDHLKSKYLVFTSNFHGQLEAYLTEMWTKNEAAIRQIWQFCVAFSNVKNAQSFIDYIKQCQITTTLFFNGSTDDALQEQLKSLYIKQAFSEFAVNAQGLAPEPLQAAFQQFLEQVQLNHLQDPTWLPGQATV